MRRITRIHRCPAAIVQCLQAPASTPQQTVASRAAATCVQRPRDFSTTPNRLVHNVGKKPHESAPEEENIAWEKGTTSPTGAAEQQQPQQEAAEQALDAYDQEADAVAPAAEIETDLILPPEVVDVAPRMDQLAADGVMSYGPSISAHGLPVVGGLAGWFDRDEHWGASKRYAGFAPTHRADDPALLELNVRRAVAEALAVAAAPPAEAPPLTGLWERGGREDAERALGMRLGVRGEDGAADVAAAEAEAVARSLRWDPDAPGSSARPGEEVGRQQFSPDEAREIVRSWDEGWKSISLHDNKLKFAVTKRILQLTGHRIPDSKLLLVHTAGDLVALLVKPAPPTKVAEAIEQLGELTSLPNVRVYATRRTPVHKHQEVGRWKVIVEELEKRKMPATGDGGIGRFVEDKWLRGPSPPKKERKKRR